MPKKKHTKIIIEGITDKGEKFRPSDWAERMSDSLSTFKRRRVLYSPLLRPITKNGNKCVIVDNELEETHPNLYKEILKFAQTNKLKIDQDKDDDEEKA